MIPLGTEPRQLRRAALALPPGLPRRTAKRLAGLRIELTDFTAEEQRQRWHRPQLLGYVPPHALEDGADRD